MFTAFTGISSGFELVWTMIPSMQNLESFFWPPQRHIFASRCEKISPWNRPITVRAVVGLLLETLRGPGLSLPQICCILAFALQKANSTLGLTFWYLCQIFLQIYWKGKNISCCIEIGDVICLSFSSKETLQRVILLRITEYFDK